MNKNLIYALVLLSFWACNQPKKQQQTSQEVVNTTVTDTLDFGMDLSGDLPTTYPVELSDAYSIGFYNIENL